MAKPLCRPPREPDLVLPALGPFDGSGLAPDGDHDTVELTGLDLTGADGRGTRFLDCALRDLGLDETRLGGARFLGCEITGVRGVGTRLEGTQLRDVRLTEARLGGTQLYDAVLERVVVRGGKFDYLNLRGARLRDVAFEGCVLIEPDLAGARLERVTFDDCELLGADLRAATLTDVDLRRARTLVVADGVERLAGAVVTPTQLLDLAPSLAAHLGLHVEP